jgi:hypothetical protein
VKVADKKKEKKSSFLGVVCRVVVCVETEKKRKKFSLSYYTFTHTLLPIYSLYKFISPTH